MENKQHLYLTVTIVQPIGYSVQIKWLSAFNDHSFSSLCLQTFLGHWNRRSANCNLRNVMLAYKEIFAFRKNPQKRNQPSESLFRPLTYFEHISFIIQQFKDKKSQLFKFGCISPNNFNSCNLCLSYDLFQQSYAGITVCLHQKSHDSKCKSE